MIFASVGSVLPFDRLVRAVDVWAGENSDVKVIMQIGHSQYVPKHTEYFQLIDHTQYRLLLESCDLFVAHVGIGSILQALELKKQMLLMPRLASNREHTTDHQLHTAKKFRHYDGIKIVDNELQLQKCIADLLLNPLVISDSFSTEASDALIQKVKNFLS